LFPRLNFIDNTIMNQHWILKDKKGNPPSPEDYRKCMKCLQKLDRKDLFPCPSSPDDLEMPKKYSDSAPREMNSFIVFRRQLAHVFKQRKLSDDGKVLSRAASYIWNGARKDEKDSYVLMAEELKRRHLLRYPDYTYERRKRKTAEEDFVIVNTDTFRENKKKKTHTTQKRTESSIVHKECEPISTSSTPTQEWYDSYDIHSIDNYCDSTLIQQSYDSEYQEDSRDPIVNIGDVSIPLVANSILSPNYTDVSIQQLQQMQQQIQVQIQQQQLQQQLQQLSQQLSSPPYYISGLSDFMIDGGDSGISQPLNGFFTIARPMFPN
jgi:hypothetical protein